MEASFQRVGRSENGWVTLCQRDTNFEVHMPTIFFFLIRADSMKFNMCSDCVVNRESWKTKTLVV